MIAFVTAAVVLGIIAFVVLRAKPRILPAPAPSVTSSSASPALPVDATGTPAPQPAISTRAVTRPVEKAEPAPLTPPRAATSGNPCDPPFVYDPVTNVKRYKTECL